MARSHGPIVKRIKEELSRLSGIPIEDITNDTRLDTMSNSEGKDCIHEVTKIIGKEFDLIDPEVFLYDIRTVDDLIWNLLL